MTFLTVSLLTQFFFLCNKINTSFRIVINCSCLLVKLLFITQDLNFLFYCEIKVRRSRGLFHLLLPQFSGDIGLN